MAGNNSDRFVSRMDLQAANLAAAWDKFKAEFGIYCVAKGILETNHEQQVANLLLMMGPDCVPIYSQFQWRYDEIRTIDSVMKRFDNHFQPVKNVIYERSVFNNMAQGHGQSLSDFITDVRCQGDICEYGEMRDELVRDRIVVGVKDPSLRQYLIDIEDLTLERCILKARQYTSQREQLKEMSGAGHSEPADMNVDYVNFKSGNARRGRGAAHGAGRRPRRDQPSNKENCFFCGKEAHPRDKCPARLATCHKCHEVGHWARSRACKGKKNRAARGNGRELAPEMEELYLGSDSD